MTTNVEDGVKFDLESKLDNHLSPVVMFLVPPQGIEPCPLVLQTSVRTSYTRAAINLVGHRRLELRSLGLRGRTSPSKFVTHCEFGAAYGVVPHA